MKMRNKIVFLTTLIAGLSAFQAAQAADTNAAVTATISNPVIARGTGLEITRGDLDDSMAGIRSAYQKQGQSLSPDQAINIEKRMLNQLIVTKLLLAKATDADRTAGKKVADLQITAAIENAGSEDAFVQQLKANALTESDVRTKITQQATAQAVVQRELNVTVTDDEVKNYYDAHTFDYEQPEMVRIAHILIYTIDPVTRAALPDDQQLARRRLVDDLVKRIQAGADFQTLAKQVSQDAGSKDNGGVLLPFPRGQMLREIEDTAFSLTNNQVSDVITTASGYQIVKLLEKIPAKKTGYLAAIAQIRQGLAQQKTAQLAAAYLDGLEKASAVEILDPNLKSVAGTAGNGMVTPPVAAAKP